MKITDDTKGIKVEVETSIVTTNFEFSYAEMAAAIGQFMRASLEHSSTVISNL